ncbi:MAG: SufD family Fe-S cluster assembly protein [Patescibacteria group bacterium]|nr:SufD family Fe-S cluster assembly protein [Patescibacteria group bacterium]
MRKIKKTQNVNYRQTDNKPCIIRDIKGAEILPSKIAREKYVWTKKYFSKKPKNGYFIWAKEQCDLPVSICVDIAEKNANQNLENLLIIEKNLKIKVQGICSALKKKISGKHQSKGKIIIKENSTLEYNHIDLWNAEDIVDTNYEFLLEKNAKLNYNYKNFSSAKKLKINTKAVVLENSCAEFNVIGNFSDINAKINDIIVLKGKFSSGMSKIRLVGNKNSKIVSNSEIKALSESKGHLDCQSMLVDKSAEIFLSPKLVCKNKKAQITHEASIGKILAKEINYLRTRGLSEKQAIDLIINGFLEQ